MEPKATWEDLRKEARYLENEIDTKLVSYSKVGAATTFTIISEVDSDSDTSPLIPSTSSGGGEARLYETLSEELDGLLKKLSQVNNDMNEIAASNAALSTPAAMHTIQRHRDILQDYSQEFKKTQTNLRSRREREELLHGVKKEIDSSKTALNRRLDIYMKEHDHLKTSERLVDEQIVIAMDTKENLVNQRVAFKKIQSRINDITTRFPAINNLIQKISLKKRKDSIIVGLVIGTCLFLLFVFALR